MAKRDKKRKQRAQKLSEEIEEEIAEKSPLDDEFSEYEATPAVEEKVDLKDPKSPACFKSGFHLVNPSSGKCVFCRKIRPKNNV